MEYPNDDEPTGERLLITRFRELMISVSDRVPVDDSNTLALHAGGWGDTPAACTGKVLVPRRHLTGPS